MFFLMIHKWFAFTEGFSSCNFTALHRKCIFHTVTALSLIICTNSHFYAVPPSSRFPLYLVWP